MPSNTALSYADRYLIIRAGLAHGLAQGEPSILDRVLAHLTPGDPDDTNLELALRAGFAHFAPGSSEAHALGRVLAALAHASARIEPQPISPLDAGVPV